MFIFDLTFSPSSISSFSPVDVAMLLKWLICDIPLILFYFLIGSFPTNHPVSSKQKPFSKN